MLEVEDKGSYICSKMLTNKSFYGEIHIKIIKLWVEICIVPHKWKVKRLYVYRRKQKKNEFKRDSKTQISRIINGNYSFDFSE